MSNCDYTIGIVGNPNCGKTTLFNELTGAKQHVGNWPGVTIDRKSGNYTYDGKKIEIVDLPGIYSLSASSLDEEVARNYILSGEADLIVNIIDASNPERNLYLTCLLVEMRIPLVIALNMMDTAEANNIDINTDIMSHLFGCPVVPLVASKGKGINTLKSEINRAAELKSIPTIKVQYPAKIEESMNLLISLIRDMETDNNLKPDYAAIKLLEKDSMTAKLVDGSIMIRAENSIKQIEEELGEESDILIAGSRYELIGEVVKQSVKKKARACRTFSDKIDGIVLNRVLGIPVFFAAMYLMFMFTINIGGVFIDFFDILSGTVFVDGFGRLLNIMHFPELTVAVLAGGIGGGIQTVTTFIPPIGFMFLFLSFLEDSGYMARGAFVMDRFMRMIGLPGKSFVPLLVGFGCNVPAIMATRTLENQRDRIMTIMMNPFMSCGARLPVYALFAAAFFPVGGQNLVFLLYLIGICFAVFTGFVLKTTTLKGEVSPFVMELPPYHMPTIKGVVMRAWDRLKAFIFRAGKIIIMVVIVLSVLNSMGTDGTFGNNNTGKSILSCIGKAITPIFAPMGIKKNNWPATVGIFTGIFAKEAIVGTLNDLYSKMDDKDLHVAWSSGNITQAGENQLMFGTKASQSETSGETNISGTNENKRNTDDFNFIDRIKQAFASIPENLRGVQETMPDSFGLSVGNVQNIRQAAKEQDVSVSTFGSMVNLFDGKAGAFAYLLFILLYFPCVAAIGAVYRETNWQWTVFAGAWTLGVAYIVASLFYQIVTINRHPVSSMVWIGALMSFAALTIFIMRKSGNKTVKSSSESYTAGRPYAA